MPKRVYVLYDGRAAHGMGTDDASILTVCETEEEAHEDKTDFGDCACYSYEDDGEHLVDEKFEWNYFGTRRY